MGTPGNVYDINTGKLLGETRDIGRPFLYQIQQLVLRGQNFYVVFGPSRHRDMRELINDIRAMGVTCVYDTRISEQILILDGDSDEWAVISS